MKFDCNQCGLCCKYSMYVSKGLLRDFDRGDGQCKYYDEDSKLCSIYENRPLICRVDDMYDNNPLVRNKFRSREDYYELNHKCCEYLQKLDKQLNSNNND